MKPTQEQLQKVEPYLKNELSQSERLAFEQQIQSNSALAEYVNIAATTGQLLSEQDWPILEQSEKSKDIASKFLNDDAQEFAKKAAQFMETKQQTKTRKFTTSKKWIVAAAAAVLIAFVYTQFFTPTTLEQQYANFVDWNELPSFATKSDSIPQPLLQLEQRFYEGNYLAVINESLDAQLLLNASKANILLYRGAAQLELNNFEDALQTFTEITGLNTIDAHKGYWYVAMVHLKQGDRPKTKRALEKVVANKNNFKATEARELLDQL